MGICFAVGYAARLNSAAREEAVLGGARRSSTGAPGVMVAAARLEDASIDLRPLGLMLTVLKSLREHYVDQITPEDEGRMAYDSLRAMLSSLDDPNTRFLDPAQRKLVADAAQGTFHGIGVILAIKKVKTGSLTEEHLVVVTPIESGPAAKAGLKPGDDIVAVNGRDVLPYNPYRKAEEMVKESMKKPAQKTQLKKTIDAEAERIKTGIPILEAESLLVSEDTKEVELSVVRKGSPRPIKLKITPRSFSVVPVTSALIEKDNLGYVKINCFSTAAAEQFRNAVRELKSKGAKGLVLDLRNLAGGTIDTAVEIARPILPGRPLAVERLSRGRKSTIKAPECSPEDAWRGPIVALVNTGTARMAEVLAAALRDGASAKLVGEKTYGDCSVVTILEQRDGSAVSMTTGVCVPVRSADYQGKGLAVDVNVGSAGSGDPQLKEAVKVLAAMAGVPTARSESSGRMTRGRS